jgi:hypothetical protein
LGLYPVTEIRKMTTSKRGGEDMMRTIAATALCVLCSASTVLAQQPPEARATNQPQGWEIGFSQETRDPAETGAIAIESTRGDANGLVTVQEIHNAGEKPVTKVRFAWTVVETDHPEVVLETGHTAWCAVGPIPSAGRTTVDKAVVSLPELQDRVAAEHPTLRHIDVTISVAGVEYLDGTKWVVDKAIREIDVRPN